MTVHGMHREASIEINILEAVHTRPRSGWESES